MESTSHDNNQSLFANHPQLTLPFDATKLSSHRVGQCELAIIAHESVALVVPLQFLKLTVLEAGQLALS